MRLFDTEQLLALADERRSQYAQAKPFPHAVIDDAFTKWVLSEAFTEFPTPDELSWYRYDNPLEKKLAADQIEKLPGIFQLILFELNSSPFVRFLETLTGIEGLIPDPHYTGGGLHQITRGGKLDVHADFNRHRRLGLDRRVNVLLYLNDEWLEEYGGHLELWDDEMRAAVKRILPIFNRLVVFTSTDTSFHGHPEPLTCPEGMTRKSIATYYYTSGRPEAEASKPHSTLYQKRPADQEDRDLDNLREKRAKGRLDS